MKTSFSVRQTPKPLSSINITPFVDVMLVLLIVFMITAPLLTVGVKVNLPQVNASNLNEPSQPLVISITQDGALYIGTEPSSLQKLIPQIKAITKNDISRPLFLRGDTLVSYGDVMKVMTELNINGYQQISLVTTPHGS
jgi:biopolymer transport protein TolR